jgi:hypothetical protein
VPRQGSTRRAPAKRGSRKRGTAGNGSTAVWKTPTTREERAAWTEKAHALILAAWPAIVEGLIAKAAEGGYQQAKLLLDLIESAGMQAAMEVREMQQKRLLDVLLEDLELTPDEAAAAGSQETTEEHQPENAGEHKMAEQPENAETL